MAAAPSPRPSFRSAAYWAELKAIADDLINHTTPGSPQTFGEGRGALQRLSNRGFGPASLFDLCTLLVLAAPRPPADAPPTGESDPVTPLPPTTPASSARPAATAELTRGPVTVAARPTERRLQHLRALEGAVAEALSISPEQPRARDAARRALMARGRTVQDATAVYGIICELFGHAAS
ncbi:MULTISPECIES: hypothetical protein [Streptomyces]